MRVHFDTDFGGDPDDACALALLLGWPDVEVTGITTVLDARGVRAGCVSQYLNLAGRTEIPLLPGAESPLKSRERFESTAEDSRYWPQPVMPVLSPPEAALDLLHTSIERGAIILATGPLTNLAALEAERPGVLEGVQVVFMGGWIRAPEAGLPEWGPEMDWNTQCDTTAVQVVADRAVLTLVTLPATLKVHLRASHLQRLRASGPVGKLLARQAEIHAQDTGMREIGRAHSGLPADLLNFHYDPLATAVGLGWPAVTAEEMRLLSRMEGAILRFQVADSGRRTSVVTDVNASEFTELWLTTVGRI